jgi:AraC-like DNA-binding protein
MEPLLHDVKSLLKNSIYVKELTLPYLDDKFHYHNTYEICYILKCSGKRIIGDSIEYFTDGDLTLLAPNVPHISYSNTNPDTEDEKQVHAFVVYFNPDWLTETHLNSPELLKIRELFEHMKRGLKIGGETKKKIVKSIFKLKTSTGLEGIITLLDILVIISKSNDYEFLASEGYFEVKSQREEKRIDEVYEYVNNNFKEKIMLDEIASIANLTPTAFCKYFKNRTNKTFSNFVNEIRVSYACKLLCKEKLNISQICFESGFNNLTSFNRNFKYFTKMMPSEYKLSLQKGALNKN